MTLERAKNSVKRSAVRRGDVVFINAIQAHPRDPFAPEQLACEGEVIDLCDFDDRFVRVRRTGRSNRAFWIRRTEIINAWRYQ